MLLADETFYSIENLKVKDKWQIIVIYN